MAADKPPKISKTWEEHQGLVHEAALTQKEWDQRWTLAYNKYWMDSRTRTKAYDYANEVTMRKHGPRPDGPPSTVGLALRIFWQVKVKRLSWVRAMLKNLSSLLAIVVKTVADGDPSSPVTKTYWWLAGKKTWISIGMYALWAFGTYVLVPVFTQCGDPCGGAGTIGQIDTWVKYLPEIATVLLGFGLFDAAVRLEPPKKKE